MEAGETGTKQQQQQKALVVTGAGMWQW